MRISDWSSDVCSSDLRFGHAAFANGGGGGRHAGAADFGAFSDIFEDIFGEFMGGASARGRPQARRGADLRYDMEISLEEAFHGKSADKIGRASCRERVCQYV